MHQSVFMSSSTVSVPSETTRGNMMQKRGLRAHSWRPASVADLWRAQPVPGWKKTQYPLTSIVSTAEPLGQSGSGSVFPNHRDGSAASGRRYLENISLQARIFFFSSRSIQTPYRQHRLRQRSGRHRSGKRAEKTSGSIFIRGTLGRRCLVMRRFEGDIIHQAVATESEIARFPADRRIPPATVERRLRVIPG